MASFKRCPNAEPHESHSWQTVKDGKTQHHYCLTPGLTHLGGNIIHHQEGF